MKSMMWIKKGILYGLTAVFLSISLTPMQVEAGLSTVVPKNGVLKQKPSTVQTEEELKTKQEEELKAKQKELAELKVNSPDYLITCQYCGGTQESSTICSRCKGTGIMDMPGNNVGTLSMVFSCANCHGSGYEACKMCMGGKMPDPNYKTKCETWKKKINVLEEEIEQLDMQLHPENYLPKENDNKISDNNRIIVDPGVDIEWNLEVEKHNCVRCNGSGRVMCSSCKGSGYITSIEWAPDYTGNGGGQYTVTRKCTCDYGYRSCTLCLGTGKN